MTRMLPGASLSLLHSGTRNLFFSLSLLIHLWVSFSLMSDQRSRQIDVPGDDWFLLAPVQMKAAIGAVLMVGWVSSPRAGKTLLKA